MKKMYFEVLGDTVCLVDSTGTRGYHSHEPRPTIYGMWFGEEFTERKMRNAMRKQMKFHSEPIEFYIAERGTLTKIDG